MSKLGDLWRKLTTPAPTPRPWESPEGVQVLARMRYSNPGLAAEVEKGRARTQHVESQD